MKPERLIYTYVSMAGYVKNDWGQGSPDEGVDRTAATAHKYGVPVTWMVNRGSIPLLRERIVQWHEEFGDDVILRCPTFARDAGESPLRFKQLLKEEWAAITEAFPWVKTKVAGLGIKEGEAIRLLEECGFEGVWGYCWEQVWWDGITNEGIPWGFWYVDKDRYKIPAPEGGSMVACEWTARDLHQAYHTANPCIYSTDPNDVLRAGLCSGTDVEYWKRVFQDYLRNTEHNDHVYFVQQQEAHEMENSEAFSVFPAADVEACDQMQELFFEHLRTFPITVTTLPEAIRTYKRQNRETAPAYMLTEDPLIRPEVNEYTMTLGGVGLGPWPDTFFYYDKECQMAFVKGECKPRMLRSYVGKWNMQENFAEEAPPVFVTQYAESEQAIEMMFEIGHWKPIPFGLTYWQELSGWKVAACDGAVDTKIVEGKLLFMRIALTGAPLRLTVRLEREQTS